MWVRPAPFGVAQAALLEVRAGFEPACCRVSLSRYHDSVLSCELSCLAVRPPDLSVGVTAAARTLRRSGLLLFYGCCGRHQGRRSCELRGPLLPQRSGLIQHRPFVRPQPQLKQLRSDDVRGHGRSSICHGCAPMGCGVNNSRPQYRVYYRRCARRLGGWRRTEAKR